MSPPPKVATGERTMRVSAPVFHRSGKVWRDFKFTHLEKVTGAQKLLAKRLEWLLPGLNASGVASEAVRERLKLLFEEEVRLSVEYVHVISPKALKKHVGDPTFLGVVAPVPHKTRGLLEVELALAHTAIDMLLGGAGETVALRPLTEIEEGVMTYVLIETLKALSPHLDPGLPRLRLEGLIRGVDEALSLLSEEAQVAVVQLKCVLGGQSGYLRLFIPASVLAMTQPPPEAEARRAKRAADFAAHRSRLAGVKAWLRAEIGYAAVTSADLVQLRDRDVVLVDQLTVRPDQG
ncbi:MAG: YscQ/HrcQ family type III secretion apparatus protein, partial [Myxococcota bacterium]